ncbi:MFS transporter [Dellaglioa algida]|uniref:MFS transporter n=1 Tax=Dellaglioa algida TaxID=105612 RepID=UPI0024C4B137|nr:MFS transporter [Dellaglioa algida]MDK1726655.1 MFS transporter [Dellaglioa algida]
MKIKEVSLKRLIPGLIIGPAFWLGPYIAVSSLFLPTMLQNFDATHKVQLVALFSTLGMVVAALSNMLAGWLSDRTKSRFGKRTPWLVGGSAAFMLSMICASLSPNVTVLLISWLSGQVALNFIVAPMVAWIDLASEDNQGTASGAYGGLGMAIGNNGFTIIAAGLLGQYRMGFIIFGIMTFVGTLIAAIIVHEPSNLDQEIIIKDKNVKTRFSIQGLFTAFPKWSIGRDYYLALIGKLFQGVGNFMVTGYLLFIMTDFLRKGTQETQQSIQLINGVMLIFGIAMGFVAGPVSDKFKILKLPIALSTILLGIGALSIFFFQNTIGIGIYAFTAGLGMGIWNSLDNLLNLKVIPDKDRVAFFLGIYNLGNTVTQAIAPVIAAILISMIGFSSIFIFSFIFSMIGGISIFLIKTVKR